MKQVGIVSFFDNEDGQVMDLKTRISYYVHISAIDKNDLAKMKRGTKVYFTLYTNLYMSQIDSITIIKE